SGENDIVETILDPLTCVKKGLCLVAAGREAASHRLYYELHRTLDGAQKLIFVMGKHLSFDKEWSFDHRLVLIN
ncbi:hypothetical protein MJO28_000879, partial [Puccinia striiformis f. sp. tritici]